MLCVGNKILISIYCNVYSAKIIQSSSVNRRTSMRLWFNWLFILNSCIYSNRIKRNSYSSHQWKLQQQNTLLCKSTPCLAFFPSLFQSISFANEVVDNFEILMNQWFAGIFYRLRSLFWCIFRLSYRITLFECSIKMKAMSIYYLLKCNETLSDLTRKMHSTAIQFVEMQI